MNATLIPTGYTLHTREDGAVEVIFTGRRHDTAATFPADQVAAVAGRLRAGRYTLVSDDDVTVSLTAARAARLAEALDPTAPDAAVTVTVWDDRAFAPAR